MNEVLEYFKHLGGTEYFPARWSCGRWTSFHGWLYILSSISIWAAYFTIPVSIYYFLRKKAKDGVPFKKVFFLFIFFILACGVSHLFDALMFWYPAYRLTALVLFITSLISWAAVYGLIKIMPEALQLKSPFQLEKIIHQRTSELRESNNQLVRLNNDLDNFTYLAAHDIKAPINNLEGLLSILKEESENGTPSDPEVLNRAQHSLNKVRDTVTHLVNVIKIDKNPFEDIYENHFEDILNEVITENEIIIHNSSTTVTQDFSSAPTLIYSRTALKSIIYNLVTNAVKYASPQRSPEIHLKTEIINQRIVLTIQDNGLGMDLNTGRDKIFSLFKRLHDHVDGAGVGLYVVKKIVTDKGGIIDVESRINEGSTFIIKF